MPSLDPESSTLELQRQIAEEVDSLTKLNCVNGVTQRVAVQRRVELRIVEIVTNSESVRVVQFDAGT